MHRDVQGTIILNPLHSMLLKYVMFQYYFHVYAQKIILPSIIENNNKLTLQRTLLFHVNDLTLGEPVQ